MLYFCTLGVCGVGWLADIYWQRKFLFGGAPISKGAAAAGGSVSGKGVLKRGKDLLKNSTFGEQWRRNRDERRNRHQRLALPPWVTSGAKYKTLRYSEDYGEEESEFVLVAKSGGGIRDITKRCENGAPAPPFLQALNMRGQARLHFVKPNSGASSLSAQADSDHHKVMISEQPVLQHGTVVDAAIWKQELDSGRLHVFYDKRGVCV